MQAEPLIETVTPSLHVRLARRRSARSGLTLLEITIAMAVVLTVLMASAGAFGSSLGAVNSARRTSRASVFLETVMEDLSAQSYDDLLSFNGNKVFDQASSAASEFEVDLTVTQSTVNMRRIDAVLVDKRTNREMGHVATMRSKR